MIYNNIIDIFRENENAFKKKNNKKWVDDCILEIYIVQIMGKAAIFQKKNL